MRINFSTCLVNKYVERFLTKESRIIKISRIASYVIATNHDFNSSDDFKKMIPN